MIWQCAAPARIARGGIGQEWRITRPRVNERGFVRDLTGGALLDLRVTEAEKIVQPSEELGAGEMVLRFGGHCLAWLVNNTWFAPSNGSSGLNSYHTAFG